VHELHKKISANIAYNVNYELRADIGKRFKTFSIGKVVERLHAQTFQNLE